MDAERAARCNGLRTSRCEGDAIRLVLPVVRCTLQLQCACRARGCVVHLARVDATVDRPEYVCIRMQRCCRVLSDDVAVTRY